MIDESRTLEIYGYTSDELKPHSGKPIVAVCEECGTYRDTKKCDYKKHGLCHGCAISKSHHNVSGKNNPRYVPAPPKDELVQLYVVENMPKYKVAAIYGVWSGVMNRWLSDYGIPNRGLSESHPDMSGENNPNWCGGITDWRASLYNTKAYKNWRNAIFERDDFTCQMCFDDTGGNLQAHHIEPVRYNQNNLSVFDINNGITLCKDCHTTLNWREDEFVDYFVAIIGGDSIV